MSGAHSAMTEGPAALVYRPDVLDPTQEAMPLGTLEELDFRKVTMRGQIARCTARHYGFDYDYESGELRPGDPLPEELGWLRDCCAELAGVDSSELVQALVSR